MLMGGAQNKVTSFKQAEYSTIVGVIPMLMGGAQNKVTSFKQAGFKRDYMSAFNSVQFTMYFTFFFNVDAVVCQNNGQFQVWELTI